MTEAEFEQYKKEIEEHFGSCKVLTANQDTTLKKCKGSSVRSAEKGWSWINYWRAMTGNHETRLFCSSCGQVIFVGDVPKIMQDLYVSTGDTVECHRAIGAHVWINAPQNAKYPGGRYILPLCPVCNAKQGEDIQIIKGSRVCKELGANVSEEE